MWFHMPQNNCSVALCLPPPTSPHTKPAVMSRWFLTVMLNCSISECAGKLWADKTVHALLCGKPFMAKRQTFLTKHKYTRNSLCNPVVALAYVLVFLRKVAHFRRRALQNASA